jgi:hypothetical protein
MCWLRTLLSGLIAVAVFFSLPFEATALPSTPAGAATLTIDGLGKGTAPLDGPWQFHLGDNPAWAAPGIDDTSGHDGWEQITAAAPWGAQVTQATPATHGIVAG